MRTRATNEMRFIRDTTNAPVNITNRQGFILLRKGDISTPCKPYSHPRVCVVSLMCLLLFVTVVLASGFDILLGRIEVTVPFVLPDSDYSVVRKCSCRLAFLIPVK